MIEISMTYDILPGIDLQAYASAAMKAVDGYSHVPGLVELRAHRNLLGSPQVRITTVWKSLEDWARARESSELQAFDATLAPFIGQRQMQIWGPSPLLPAAVVTNN